MISRGDLFLYIILFVLGYIAFFGALFAGMFIGEMLKGIWATWMEELDARFPRRK